MDDKSKRRGEPVAWEKAFDDAKKVAHLYNSGTGILGHMQQQYAHHARNAPQPAEPVKVPSDKELYDMAESMDAVIVCSGTGDYNDNVESVVTFARALLARYGQQAQPIDPANDNPTPEEEEAWQQMEDK